jgi:hypothetical protein
MGPLLEEVFTELEPVMSEFAALLPELIRSLFPLLPIFGDIFEVVMKVINTALPPLIAYFEVVGPLLEEMIEVFAVLLGDILEMLAPVLMDIVEAMQPMIEAAFPIFMKLVETLIPIILELVEMFLPLIDYILPVLEAIIMGVVLPALSLLADMLAVALPLAMEMFKTFGLGRLLIAMGDFSEDFQMMVYAIRVFWAESFNTMIDALETFLNGAIRGLNWFIEKANSLPGVEIQFRATEIELTRVDMPDLPRFLQQQINENLNRIDTSNIAGIMQASGANFQRGISSSDFLGTGSLFSIERLSQPNSGVTPFADGGIVRRPVIGMVGEAGPEAIIPLSKAGQMGSTYNITVNAGIGTDGARVGEAVVKAIRSYERSSGPVFAKA